MSVIEVDFPGNIAAVRTIPDLRALPSGSFTFNDLYVVTGKGLYTWVPDSFAVDDGDKVIKPNDLTPLQVGRWLFGPQGTPGLPANTYTSYAALQASDPSRKYAYLVGDTDSPPRPDGAFVNTTGQTGQWAPRNAAAGVAPAALPDGGNLDVLSAQTLAGQPVTPSRGNVHSYDVAIIGSNEVVPNTAFAGAPPASWSLSGFTASNPGVTKAAGAAGTVATNVTVTPYTLYLVTLTANTTAKGGLAVYLNNNPASNINDFPMHPVGSLTRTFYLFSYDASGSVLLEVRAEGRWAGTISKMSLVKVQREAPVDFFSVASDRKDFSNNFGIKFGRFLAGNMSMGDRTTQALLSQNAAWNVAIGSRANASVIDGFENTAVGCFTLEFNQMSRNSAFGYSALRSNMTGEQNTGLGYKALVSNTTGGNNTGVGFHAGLYNRDGSNNVVVGTLASYYAESGNYITAIGSQAGINGGGDANVYVGALSGPLRAGEFRFGYSNQVCVGTEASSYGNSTVAVGRLARCGVDTSTPGGYEITTTAVAVGMGAIAAQDSSVAIGGNANCSDIRTVAVGEQAKASAPNATALGFLSEAREQSASLGAQAGINTIGIGNTSIGYGANSFGGAMNRTNATAIGYGATTSGDNEVTLGNSAVGKLRAAVTTITAISDRRDKKDIETIDGTFATVFVKALNPVRWTWNMRDNVKRDGGDVGFIAQDLWSAQETHNAEWLDLVSNANPDRLEATPGRLIPVLAAALKQALARIEALEAK